MRDWQIYEVAPIDFGWGRMLSVEDTAVIEGDHHWSPMGDDYKAIGFEWEQVKALATATSWDGEFRSGPVVLWLPDPDNLNFDFAFAWKGGSNGTCFIASRLPLDWLGVEPF